MKMESSVVELLVQQIISACLLPVSKEFVLIVVQVSVMVIAALMTVDV